MVPPVQLTLAGVTHGTWPPGSAAPGSPSSQALPGVLLLSLGPCEGRETVLEAKYNHSRMEGCVDGGLWGRRGTGVAVG